MTRSPIELSWTAKNLLIYTFPKDCNAFVFTLFYELGGDPESVEKKVVVVFHEAKMKNYANNFEYFTSVSL